MVYIREPTADEYRIVDVGLTSSIFGESRGENLKCPVRGVLTSFTVSILNRLSIFSIYPFWFKDIVPIAQSLLISIHNIFVAAPMSFISIS